MPSPIAHGAAAYLLYRAARPSTPQLKGSQPEGASRLRLMTEFRLFGGLLFLSLLPDLDVIPGVLAGDLARFHNNVSHSFFFGALVAPLVGGAIWVARRGDFRRFAALAFLAYSLHVVMDYFTVGRGVMVWWPFSVERFSSPMPFFHGVRWAEGWWTSNHLWTLLNEVGWVALVLIAVHCRAPERR